jgi:hypothetical protein
MVLAIGAGYPKVKVHGIELFDEVGRDEVLYDLAKTASQIAGQRIIFFPLFFHLPIKFRLAFLKLPVSFLMALGKFLKLFFSLPVALAYLPDHSPDIL